MDIYYFASPDEEPEEQDDWSFWNLVIPLKDKHPRSGDPVFIFNYETGQSLIQKIMMDDEVKKWPFKFPEAMKMGTIKTIFRM